MERRSSGRLEQEVLAVLAAAGRPLRPAEVQQSLGRVLAYTTVMTTLTRLVDKGVLQREPAGRAFAYHLEIDATAIDAALTGRRMSRLLDRGADRAAALAHFVADLQPEDEELLADLLAGLPDGRSEDPAEGGSGS